MPTYDYQCRDCGHTIEVIHPMLEDGPSTCERCGGELRRILYPAGIIFRGSGFYKTDSRSSSSASVTSGSAKSTPAAGGGAAGGSASPDGRPSGSSASSSSSGEGASGSGSSPAPAAD